MHRNKITMFGKCMLVPFPFFLINHKMLSIAFDYVWCGGFGAKEELHFQVDLDANVGPG